MIRNELPTFRKWGKKLLVWRRAIIIALLMLGIHRVGTNYFKQYYAVIVPCDQPCQDAISCDPLEFTFEITPTKIKLGQPYYLWYRARIKNRTCRKLSPIAVDGFLDSKDLRKIASHLWVTVTGPDGREVERLPVPRPDGGISWDYGSTRGVDISTEGTIHPYQPNFEQIRRLRKSAKLKEPGYVALMPGEAFETITPTLRPYRIVATSFRTEDGGIADGYRWVQAANPPKFPTPPEGFNILDRYTFTRPGRYAINAGYRDTMAIYPIFARWENRFRWLDLFFWPTYPSNWDSTKRDVDLSAPPVVIEISR